MILTRSLAPAAPTPAGVPHYIGCSLGEVFQQARSGERVWLDDGKIGGTIDRVTDDEIELTVTDVRPGGANLRAGKGINLPDTDLQLSALTPKDLEDLTFVARHADVVNLSFVCHPEDIQQLHRELDRLDASDMGVVLKIENVAAFENLPELLLASMRSEKLGVMIARGDLAVEVGFERLAEVQEEIMWACEAAHMPVIWATQVLDTLALTGQPSRAEITDAAMAATRRVRHAQQGAPHRRGDQRPRLDPHTDAGPPGQETQPAPPTARLGPCLAAAREERRPDVTEAAGVGLALGLSRPLPSSSRAGSAASSDWERRLPVSGARCRDSRTTEGRSRRSAPLSRPATPGPSP